MYRSPVIRHPTTPPTISMVRFKNACFQLAILILLVSTV